MDMFKVTKWALSTKDERKLREVRDRKDRKSKGGRGNVDDVVYTNGFIVSGPGCGTSYVAEQRRGR